ncbi:hypothetical protein ONZ45_g6776 [Pleurotus djamor]|nr:hypothetical protein ONZ45_g6776 [Pleurotus djamor]
MGSPCFEGDIEEVEVDDQDGEDSREERRAKIWSGISEQVNATARAALGFPTLADGDLEEGEIPHSVIGHVQTAMMSLHVLLQAHVTATFDPQLNPATPSVAPADPTGQATLASVIARAQSNLPTRALPADVIMADATLATEPSHGDAAPAVTADDAPSLSMIGLSAEQALLLEQAIANAALAAQAQAEAEAALEEEEEDYDDQEGEGEYDDMEQISETAVENS